MSITVASLLRSIPAGFDGVLMQRTRAAFTALGIGVGAVALISVGSLVFHLAQVVATSEQLSSAQLIVWFDRSFWLSPHVERDMNQTIAEIRQQDGVTAVTRAVVVPYELLSPTLSLKPPAYIFDRTTFELVTSVLGRRERLSPPQRYTAIVGADFAASAQVSPGDLLSLYGNAYRVGTILPKTYSFYDNAVIVSNEGAAHLAHQLLPSGQTRSSSISVTALLVRIGATADRSGVMREIGRLPGLRTSDPLEQVHAVKATLAVFQAIMLVCSVIAVLVSALSVLNTMSMAVSERRAEIALRRALGATKAEVLGQFIVESAALGVAGSVVGILLSAGAVAFEGSISSALGITGLLDPAPGVAAAAIIAVIVLSMLAGLWPALCAVAVSPSAGLRNTGL